ncbi:ABC transporter permease [Streptomyces sp. B21-083]|uniref:ABC transporter permease n=1 Tax=Streptomyces sp. B21-083 TaxID=3039410 RepID=UPI002FF3A4D1
MTSTTALAVPASPRRTRLRPHGLPAALLILHRSALWFWLLLVAVAAGTLLWTYGYGLDAAFAQFTRAGCHDGAVAQACDYSGGDRDLLGTAVSVGRGLLNVVPLLTAAWAGGALISRELENGTAQLAWTQSVSPARWLAAKLAVPGALLVTGTALLTFLHRLVWDKHSEVWGPLGSWKWHENGNYFANGTLATAYPLLGLALGALAGLLLRRPLPALGVAVLSLLTLMSVLDDLRPHLWPVETLTRKTGYPEWTGMVVGDGALTSTGKHVSDPYCVSDTKCLADHDIVGYFRDYHPASHFWPLQLMETGIVLALTAAATAATFWLLRRRTA